MNLPNSFEIHFEKGFSIDFDEEYKEIPVSPLDALVELKKTNLPKLSFIIILIKYFANKILENELIWNDLLMSLDFKLTINLSTEIVARFKNVTLLSILLLSFTNFLILF